MDIHEYVNQYDFSKVFSKQKESFLEQTLVEKYLQKYKEERFVSFSQEFWSNCNSPITKLKQKYKISSSIAYSDILKAYPTDDYIKFLKAFYSEEATLEDIIKYFKIPSNKINDIIIPIEIENYDGYCPKCFANCFEMVTDVYNPENGISLIRCNKCGKKVSFNNLITAEEVEKNIRGILEAKKEFEEKCIDIQSKINEIQCPRCQEQLLLKISRDKLIYSINCSKCQYSNSSVEETIIEYKQWKQRAAMMIAIKAKEQEMIEKAIESKKIEDVFFKKEDIISVQETYEAFEFALKLDKLDNLQSWGIIFSEIKKCNRLERKILIDVLKLAKENNKRSVLSSGENEITVYRYSSSEPLISELINKTKVVVVRQVLRNLIKRNLLIVDEVSGQIFMLPVLVENLESIESLMRIQNINGQIRYMIFGKQDFSCMTCGGKGRELKIAYLTSDKNTDNLSSLIAVCDDCFEMVTRNEILIDGTITFDIDSVDEDVPIGWKFLTEYLPELKSNKQVLDSITNMENEFNSNDIINALAIAIFKLNNGELIGGSIDSLIRYANGILRNAVKSGNEVKAFKNVAEEFEIAKWLNNTI
ncbi:hypothetical protein JHL18_00160 [Clostridium sp. YIM B02505]|uniref:Uncharacterized protein n=1 Tax=Clostridium yunnanense TaxID=2800325 RepID=A0ABS1EI51_9CLOT|nr:hypothetical protein [Clostridium yunnanense]MBK1809062.1 hypothetical protein [Clostridium yunnanense]